MLDLKKELAGLKENKSVISNISFSKSQMTFIYRDLSKISEDEIWKETEDLRDTFATSYIELGRRLYELQQRYANNKNGSFQKRYQEKGFKKTQVETLVSKYQLFQEKKSIGCTATDIVMIAEKLEEASQRVTSELKKAPHDIKEKFYKGIIKGSEIKEAIKNAEIGEIEILPKARNTSCSATDKDELEKELAFLEKDIREREKNLKKLIKKREEIEKVLGR
jgi:hypothetical protein